MVSRCDDIHSGVQQFLCQTGVMPLPAAAFSPLTMMKSAPCSRLSSGNMCFTAVRPGSPTTSPIKSMVIMDWDGAGADGGFYCSSLVTGTTRTGTGDFRITELATLPRKTVERKPWLCLPTTIMSMWCFSA